MSESYVVTKAALLDLLNWAALPNPDDPDSPIGPYSSDLSWALLNPQPLPPKEGPFPDPWRRLLWVLLNPQPLPPKQGSQPDPWRSAFQARMVIDQAVGLYRAAEMQVSGVDTERAYEAARMSISEFVDDYCGNVPRRFPSPWPSPLGGEFGVRSPRELLAAGTQFARAADATQDSMLQSELQAAADQLLETGLSQMGGR